MDPRLYTYERRKPRLDNPTFKSEFVTDSLLIFKGGPLGSSSLKKDYQNHQQKTTPDRSLSITYNPSEISKIRFSFENNRSKVPLSNLSAYARQIMFPTQKSIQIENYRDSAQKRIVNPQNFMKAELYLDSKQKNYIKTICKMNEQYLSKSKLDIKNDNNKAAGKPSFAYDDKDKRFYRYKHSYHDQIQQSNAQKTKFQSLQKSFIPSRLNYADQLKGIL